MIKFKFLPVNVHCLLERESRNHFCAAENCGVNNDSRNLPHFVCERVLDLPNTGESECAIAQELGTGVQEIHNGLFQKKSTPRRWKACWKISREGGLTALEIQT